MLREMTNLCATLRRWGQPSIWLLIALALAFFGPGLWDRHRPRPWITADLAILPVEGVGLGIRDEVDAHTSLSGERLLWIEGPSGARLCSAHREDGWDGRETRIWSVPAFFGGLCGSPDHRWRACTRFVVQTGYGNRGTFGPYCSPWFDPPEI